MRRVMYVEDKSRGLDGGGRIGWVELSRSRRSFRYAGRELLKVKSGYKRAPDLVDRREYRAGKRS